MAEEKISVRLVILKCGQIKMKKYNITILVLLFELCCFNGHAILKPRTNEADTYKVREDNDTLEIINPKAKKPTLREIIYYHVIEKPYPGKHEANSNEDKKPPNPEPIHDENYPEIRDENKLPIRDELSVDDSKRPDEMHQDEMENRTHEVMTPNEEIINDKENISERNERMRRRKRETDYSKMPSPPPLPAFRMDILPDYIKDILPTEDEFSLTLKSPEFKARSAENSMVPSNTEEPEIRTEKSRNTESSVPNISIRIGGDEIHDEQIPIKPKETDHKIIKKSPINVDDDIEAEIREVIEKVTDSKRQKASQDPPSYGMDLIGNGGIVWSELNNQHYKYNVGPDAINEETHDEQMSTKPHEVNNNEENKEITNEIESSLNELEHILEEIVPNNNNLHENNSFNEGTTENDDIEIIFHKNKPKVILKHDNIDQIEENPARKKDFIPKIDPRSLIDENDDEVEPKSINPDNSIDLDTALNILEVLQEIVANSNNSGPYNDSNKDNPKEKLKDVAEPDRERKHKQKGEEDKEKCKKNEIDDLLSNDKYWEWLKDSSQATLNLLMKRANGLIKEEVAQQIQDLVTKIMEEQGYQLPGKEQEKEDHVETKQAGENDETKTDDENNEIDIAVEESDVNPQVLDKLKANDKWKWLTNSSEAYLGALMKRINKLIKEEVTRQVEHLMKYHMPSADQNKPSDNNDNKLNSTKTTEINPEKGESNNTKTEIETSKTAKDDFKTEPNRLEDDVIAKSNKATVENKKHTNRNKQPLININAENSYGSSVGNEKVTNIFIFNLNGTDLKNLKPISNGNGMFIFGTDNNELSEKPTEQTDNSNVDSTTDDSNKVEITTTEEAKPVDEEKPNLDSKENSNKDENTTSPTEEKKDNSSKDKTDKHTDPSKNETEKISGDNKNKENSKDKEQSEEKAVEKDMEDDEIETESKKDNEGNNSTEVSKTESKDETEHDSSKEDKTSEGKNNEKDSKGDERDSKADDSKSMGDENEGVKSESK